MSTTNNKNNSIFYEGDDKSLRIKTLIEDDNLWLSQAQLVELYHSSKSNVSEHLKHIFEVGELDEKSVVRNFRTTAADGKNYNTKFYSLDVVIALGYKIDSEIAIKFRQWATAHLHEYIQKGFTLDDERLKQNGGRYFRELLQRIRDIRSSERNLWQQVTDIYATSIDYNKDAKLTKEFFATVQNKMHYAVHRQTAAEVIYNRVDSSKPMIGMTNFKGDYITKEDTHIAKNYLKEDELNKLNLLVEQYLGYAELQAIREIPMKMQDWKDELDRELKHLNFALLEGKGKISHDQAVQKANHEYDKYRRKEFENYESDFDRAVEELTKEVGRIEKRSNAAQE